MNKIRKLFLVVLLLLLQSCATDPVYYPGNQITPMFDKAHQFDIHVQKLGAERGLASAVTYAISDDSFAHLGIEYANLNNCVSCSRYKKRSAEFAVAYYHWNSQRHISEYIIGGTLGQVESDEGQIFGADALEYAKSDFVRAFFQLNSGRRFGPFDIITGLRGSYFQAMDFQYVNYFNEYTRRLTGQSWNIYLEPAFTVQAHLGNLGLHTQVGISYGVMDVDFGSDGIWALMGLSYRFRQ